MNKITMNLSKAALILSASSLLVDADNTPNLCTADIPNLTKIKPSETANHTIANITVGDTEYSGDADHFVMTPPLFGPETIYAKLLVYIPGTTDRPELSSCLLKSAAENHQGPVIGLSYQYLSSGDSFRNGKCASLNTTEDQIECLDEQHKDAIDGGNYGATHLKGDGSAFWGEVLPENSLTRRLGDLLAHLHTTHPDKGWGGFSQSDGEVNEPNWSRIAVMGHSQGAGHAAYLAKAKPLFGAVMISGPQDECTDCPEGTKFWIDEAPLFDSIYTALGHASEPLILPMKDNWARMNASMRNNWRSAEPKDVDFGLDISYYDACNSPLVTNVKYGSTSTCGGKEHCSTAIDDSVPFIEKSNGEKHYLYEKTVWPALVVAANDKNPCKRSYGKSKKSKASKVTFNDADQMKLDAIGINIDSIGSMSLL